MLIQVFLRSASDEEFTDTPTQIFGTKQKQKRNMTMLGREQL